MPKGTFRPPAECHPDKPHFAKGLCAPCYARKRYESPRYKVKTREYRKKAWAKYRETTRRRQHSFTVEDEIRFQAATNCDWCGQPFKGQLAHIDHNHSCCPTERHCSACTRGFVHAQCNQWAINHAEWLERNFGIVTEQLRAYREKFPLRVVRLKDSQEVPAPRVIL